MVSVQWGAWAGAGMAAGDAYTSSRVERTGMALLPPQQGLAVLESLLTRQPAVPLLAANPFVWSKFMQRLGAAVPALFADFAAQDTAHGAAGGGGRAAGAKAASLSSTDRKAAVLSQVQDAVRSIMGSEVAAEEPLMAAGLDSLGAVELKNSLEGRLGLQLPGTLVFDYPSTSALVKYLEESLPATESDEDEVGCFKDYAITSPTVDMCMPSERLLVAITGMASRSAADAILSAKPLDIISPVPIQRWDLERVAALQGGLPARFGGFLPAAEEFDMAMFGLSSTEAELMDAQQRLLLELSLEVRESNGILGGDLKTGLNHILNACTVHHCL